MIAKALEILRTTDPALLADACLDLDLLDELALDPRGYDFDHPADKRPNYGFGEWDPQHIDNRGNYRRFVIRQITLEGLWQRVESHAGPEREEFLFEAAAVLACTILMAAGVSGSGPTTYDSSVNLGNLVPRIAKYRDSFYATLLASLQGEHGERLRRELKVTRQPFGGARQHINRYLAQQRALQMQQRHLALLFADIGYPAASRRQLQGISASSLRLLTEMHILLSAGNMGIDQGDLALAATNLPAVEDLLKKGIACGALVDPWNILGFQGQFPRSAALEDSIRDQRIEVARARGGTALQSACPVSQRSSGRRYLHAGCRTGQGVEQVGGLVGPLCDDYRGRYPPCPRRGSDGLGAAGFPGIEPLAQRGSASADLSFWREHLDDFHSPKAFALVVDTLLRKQDYRAAMSLLMTWLSQVEEVPLEDGEFSFHHLALRWMLGICALAAGSTATAEGTGPQAPIALVAKFFDYLEANAEDFGQVPRLDLLGTAQNEPPQKEESAGDEESLFGAAYEDMTYKDSTDDDVEAEVLDFMPQKDFDLAQEAERLEKRLKFLATQARLWNVATRALREAGGPDGPNSQEALAAWLAKAHKNYLGLLALLDTIHEHDIPKPSGSFDSLVEFDNRRGTKERLLSLVISTCLDQALAVGALRGARAEEVQAAADDTRPSWELLVIRLERALLKKEPAQARAWLPEFIRLFKREPLLYTPLTHGGHPRQILRASTAQTILRSLVTNLPRQGLLRETYQLVLLGHSMEQAQTLTGQRVTEFDHLFKLAVQAVTEAFVDAAQAAAIAPEAIVHALESVAEPFLTTWRDHSKTLRVSILETVAGDQDWTKLTDFIKKYGHDLFHAALHDRAQYARHSPPRRRAVSRLPQREPRSLASYQAGGRAGRRHGAAGAGTLIANHFANTHREP